MEEDHAVEFVALHDGPGTPSQTLVEEAGDRVDLLMGGAQEGFCSATEHLWRHASLEASLRSIPYVFWLEHDFLFRVPFKIDRMREILRNTMVAQVSLMRQACNDVERAAGGVSTAS